MAIEQLLSSLIGGTLERVRYFRPDLYEIEWQRKPHLERADQGCEIVLSTGTIAVMWRTDRPGLDIRASWDAFGLPEHVSDEVHVDSPSWSRCVGAPLLGISTATAVGPPDPVTVLLLRFPMLCVAIARAVYFVDLDEFLHESDELALSFGPSEDEAVSGLHLSLSQ